MTTNPNFGKLTTGTEVAECFKDVIKGKTVVVTGVSPQSLGAATATSIAAHDPEVLLFVSMTKEKMESVATEIKTRFHVHIYTVTVDLSSQKSVQQAAAEIDSLVDHIDILINSAAVVMPHHWFTEDGIELQFGTNHIGPFLLTNLLMGKLRSAATRSPTGCTRIVNLTSLGHRLSPIRFSDYNFNHSEVPDDEKHAPMSETFFVPGSAYSGFIAYGQCKTANILFSLYLKAHLAKAGIVSYAVHPGCESSISLT
ncbi:MAG: hypothetical protein Q9227_001961 [Pyrenula ochraceoflavens]